RSVMIAALGEALRGDRAARRAALDAIQTAKRRELAAAVRQHVDASSDTDVALAAIATAAALDDKLAVDPLLAALDRELAAGTHGRTELAAVELQALNSLGAHASASRVVA